MEALLWEWHMIKGWKQRLRLKSFSFFFFFGCTTACRILVSRPGINRYPLKWKYEALTTILLGKSQEFAILLVSMWGCFLVPKEEIKYTFLTKTYQVSHLSSHAVLRLCSDAVMPDSLWSHWLYPTRLLCPWDFPSKTTSVRCHFLFQGIFQTQGSNLHLLHLLH